MSDDKIKITWEDVHSKKVDAAVKRQEHITRTQEHQAQAANRPMPASPGKSSILRHSLFYLALFGLIGGVLAWGLGEVVQKVEPQELREFARAHQELERRYGEEGLALSKLKDHIETLADANPYWALTLELVNGEIDQREYESRFEAMKNQEEDRLFVWMMLFCALVGFFIAVFLCIAEPVVSGNWNRMFLDGSIAALLGILAGILVSLFINRLYRAMGGGQGADSLQLGQLVARSIGWGILGLFMAIAPGITMRSLKKTLIGVVGGLLGGLLGGMLFDPIAYLTNDDVLSRAAGIISIGLLSGLAIGLIEDALKTGWFKVVTGMIAGKQFILYRNPTSIGSSPQCDIYLFKDREIEPSHALVHLHPGRITIQSVGAKPTYVNGQAVNQKQLRGGDQVQIGGTVFIFQERTGK